MDYSFYNGYADMLYRDGAKKTGAYAARLGFRGVEMIVCGNADTPLSTIPDVKAAESVKADLKAEGVYTSCYSVGTTVDSALPPSKNPVVLWLEKQVEITAALGCPYFHHTLHLSYDEKSAPHPFSLWLPYAAECAATVADYAKTFGITCLYEPQGYYVSTKAGFAAFYSEVKKSCENIGVCGDCGNMLFADEEPVDFLTDFAKEIRHVHLKDYAVRDTRPAEPIPGEERLYGSWDTSFAGKYLRDILPGEGNVNLQAYAKLLKDADYNGALSLEFHPFDCERDFPAAMRYFDTLFR